MHFTILSFLTLWKPLGYLIFFLGGIIEGDIILFTAAFLTNQGFFDPLDMFFTVFSGVILGDIFWYYLGRSFMMSSSKIERWIGHLTQDFDERIHNHLFYILLITKFAYGFHHPILIRVGVLGKKFKQFIVDDLAATLIWIFVVGGLGFVSSASFLVIKKYIKYGEVSILFFLIVFVVIPNVILRRRLKNLKNHSVGE